MTDGPLQHGSSRRPAHAVQTALRSDGEGHERSGQKTDPGASGAVRTKGRNQEAVSRPTASALTLTASLTIEPVWEVQMAGRILSVPPVRFPVYCSDPDPVPLAHAFKGGW